MEEYLFQDGVAGGIPPELLDPSLSPACRCSRAVGCQQLQIRVTRIYIATSRLVRPSTRKFVHLTLRPIEMSNERIPAAGIVPRKPDFLVPPDSL